MPSPLKRRKTTSENIDEIHFDSAARHEYLTGFHKRKVQRTKQAQEAAAKRARAERIADRRKTREERKASLSRRLHENNALLRAPEDSADEEAPGGRSSEDKFSEWAGVSEGSKEPEMENYEADYVDEDKNTTVTVEAVDISKNGLYKAERASDLDQNSSNLRENLVIDPISSHEAGTQDFDPQIKRPKKKRKSFRYETKAERKASRLKDKLRNSKRAWARKNP